MDKPATKGVEGARRLRGHDPEETRRNIIEVAMREFAENGLAGARIDEIAERTRSSKRMIYYYFTDKEGLYLRCLEEAYRVVRSGETRLKLEHLAPLEGLRRLVEFTFDHHNSHPDFIRMVMIENVHRADYLKRSQAIRQLNATAIDNLARLYERGLADGSFRAGLKPLDLHWQISALCFFNVSNRATFGAIFGVKLGSAREQQQRRAQVVDLITAYVRTPQAEAPPSRRARRGLRQETEATLPGGKTAGG